MFGGTFDPPHVGHLVAAIDARQALELDIVLLVVANAPWQKIGSRQVSPAADRLAMVRAAVADAPGLEVSDIEIARGGLSYTADTLEALRGQEPGAELFLLERGVDPIGEDRAHLVGAVPDDHDRVGGVDVREGAEDPPDQRSTRDFMKDLRPCRPHPGAESGGEHDHTEIHRGSLRGGGEHDTGWGGRIRTSDHGTKTRCLTAWLRPTEDCAAILAGVP